MNNTPRLFYILFSLFILISSPIFSQSKGTFRGYAQLGFSTNQISGDSMAGYNYWGVRGGGGAYFMMTKFLSANLEINYVMRGASGDVYDIFNQYLYHRQIRMQYIEVPLLINYHDGNIARFGLGPVLSTLMSSSFYYNKKEVDNATTQSLLKTLDLGICASVSFDIKKHFGINLRMNQSILPINNPRPGEENQYNNSLSLNGMYYF